MHALHHLPPHLLRTGLLALGLTLVLLVLAALVAPAVVDLATPPATTVETAGTHSPSPPAWATDPLAPPALLQAR
jgi:hypothetical protein